MAGLNKQPDWNYHATYSTASPNYFPTYTLANAPTSAVSFSGASLMNLAGSGS